MANDGDDPGPAGQLPAELWRKGAIVRVSDDEILRDAVAQVDVAASAEVGDKVYAAFLEAKKGSDAWFKYYFIEIALLLLTYANAVKDAPLLGFKLEAKFVAPAAIVAFSVCTAVWTHNELRMRLFRTFFKARLEAADGPARAHVLLRYPMAFYGFDYSPFTFRPRGFVVGWDHVAASIPMFVLAGLLWLLAFPGLGFLVFQSMKIIYLEPDLPLWIKVFVTAALGGSLVLGRFALRNAKRKHAYEFDDRLGATRS